MVKEEEEEEEEELETVVLVEPEEKWDCETIISELETVSEATVVFGLFGGSHRRVRLRKNNVMFVPWRKNLSFFLNPSAVK